MQKFEPESFVDGLLGIGVAGGGSSKEGKALASRLSQMRKERSQRAKTTTTAKPSSSSSSSAASPVGGGMGGGPAGKMTLQGLEDIGNMDMEEEMGEMQLITPGGGGAGKSKSKNNKKKKTRKNKK